MSRATSFSLFLCAALSLLGCTSGGTEGDLPDVVDFNYHIRPILSNSCYVCHGPDPSSREAELRLDAREFATARREGGARAIVPGSPGRSLLIHKVSAEDPEQRMPPPETNKVLTPHEVALLRRWVKQGAEYKEHWAFIPPAVSEWPESDRAIDNFIEQRLARTGLEPAPEAPPEVLLRRASYVLTGLPPDPAQVRAIHEDGSFAAYARAVDTLLASPHYGERWARHWMDLVRYAESKGHEFDFSIQGAWRYRDYLIRAFNADVPYDQFVTEHLAGDLMARPRVHPEEGYDESALGTAYFAFGEGKHSPVDTRIDEAERIDNIIDVTTKTFQALTVACARCHDHKFDPIPTTDYYSLYGIVESARFASTPLISSHYQHQLDSVVAVSSNRKRHIAERWLRSVDSTPVISASLSRSYPPATTARGGSTDHVVLGDFREGTFDGWYAEGPAFTDGPTSGVPVFSAGTLDSLVAGAVSSRGHLTGVPGALRSPTFEIAHDSLVVLAAGTRSVVRIVLDNFHLIRAPIHGGLDRELDTPTLTPYVFDVGMWKGTKAYIELLVGTYDKSQFITDQHLLQVADESFFDVAYAVAYDSTRPVLERSDGRNPGTLTDAIRAWSAGTATPAQVSSLNEALRRGRLSRRITEVQTMGSVALPEVPFFLGMTDGDTVTSGVFFRGNALMEEEAPVPHRFFTVLDASHTPFDASASGRLDLARAITAPDNPLTARVMVNRMWHHVFGRGIVETVDNFGAQGMLPTHPELLDYLALRFVEQGWSIKALLREMLLSSAFRRATAPPDGAQEIDPQNLLFSHYSVRRLEAEAIRDGILAASGQLDPTLFGPSVPIHLTEFMKGRGRPKESGPLSGEGRRSVYISVRRNFLSPMMLAFDKPIPFSTFGKRNTSNVPAQSLTMLNDPFVADQADAWGESLAAMPHGTIEERVVHIFLHAVSREPTGEEIEQGRAYIASMAEEMQVSPSEIMTEAPLWAAYCHVIFNLKEFIYLI